MVSVLCRQADVVLIANLTDSKAFVVFTDRVKKYNI